MIINLDDAVNTEKLKGILEENEKVLSQYKGNYEKLVKEQEKILTAYINKVAPIMNHIIDKGYRFSHPSINFSSESGPILDYDNKKNLLYIWDVKSHIINEINMYKQDDKQRIPLYQFVRFRNFENAINGILVCLKLQNELIGAYQKEIDEKERIIAKYRDIINC